MRVLHVVQSLSKKFGGVQTMVLGLTHFQAQSGMEVEVATTNVVSPTGPGVLDVATDRAVNVDGVQTHYYPVQFRPLLFSRQLKAFLDTRLDTFDIVHIHGLYRFPMTYTAYRCRTSNIPYIIRPHGSLDPYLYYKSSRSLILKRVYERWFDLPNLHAASGIHYTAREEMERVAFLGLRAPGFVVPNGIDWHQYEKLPSRGAFRAFHGLGDAPIVLFLGRIHFKKGLDLLIPAFDRLLQMHPSALLVIAGPEHDDYGDKVRGWVRERGLDDRVFFVGHLDADTVIQAYVDADLFTLPSYTENFGNTVVEAMACGLPVVISDQVNIHEQVSVAGAGLVTHCDVVETAEALGGLLANPNRRQTMGLKARTAAKSLYSWPAIVGTLKTEYEAIIARTSAAVGKET